MIGTVNEIIINVLFSESELSICELYERLHGES